MHNRLMEDGVGLYWVSARIDGCVYVLGIEATRAEAAKKEVFRALHRGERSRYRLRDGGKVTVEWRNVATLRARPAVRVTAPHEA